MAAYTLLEEQQRAKASGVILTNQILYDMYTNSGGGGEFDEEIRDLLIQIRDSNELIKTYTTEPFGLTVAYTNKIIMEYCLDIKNNTFAIRSRTFSPQVSTNMELLSFQDNTMAGCITQFNAWIAAVPGRTDRGAVHVDFVYNSTLNKYDMFVQVSSV